MNCVEIASWFFLEIRWYIIWLSVPSKEFSIHCFSLYWTLSDLLFSSSSSSFFSFSFQTSLSSRCHIVCDCDWALESFGDLFTYYCSWVTSTLLIPAKQANKKLWELIFPTDHGHRIRNLSIKRNNSFVHTCRSFLVLETSCSPMATQPTKQNHQTSRLNEWLKKNTPRPFSTWLTHLQAFSELFF